MENTISSLGKETAGQFRKYIEVLNQRNSVKAINGNQFESYLNNLWLAAGKEELFSKLAPFLEKVDFSEGEYIYQPEDSTNYVYFPETVVVSEFQILKDGRNIEIAMTGSEGIIGILSVFDAPPASNRIQVLVPGKAFKIKLEILKSEILKDPSFQILMFEYINNYIKQIAQRAICNICHSLEERFSSWLLLLQKRQKSDILKLTHEHIALSLGAPRPSITTIAQDLRKRKIIDYSRGKLRILNQQQLRKTACSCYAKIDNNSIFL